MSSAASIASDNDDGATPDLHALTFALSRQAEPYADLSVFTGMSLPAQLSVTGGTDRLRVILVVEDEALVRGVAADFLRDAGYSVIEAAQAAEAQSVITSGQMIDAVFTDVQMPGSMDGLQLAAWVRAHHAALPVLLTSGNRESMHAAGYLEDSKDFLPKPYALQELARRIDALFVADAAELRRLHG